MSKVKTFKQLEKNYRNTYVYVKQIDSTGSIVIDSNTSKEQFNIVKFAQNHLLKVNKKPKMQFDKDNYEEQLIKLLQQHGISYEADYRLKNNGYTMVWYEDDEWSGSRVTAEIDCFGYLVLKVYNDSPAQCEGCRDIFLYKHGKQYDLGNVADCWSYFVFENIVYLVTADRYYEPTVTIVKIVTDDISQDVRRISVPADMVNKFNFSSLQSFGASVVLSDLLNSKSIFAFNSMTKENKGA